MKTHLKLLILTSLFSFNLMHANTCPKFMPIPYNSGLHIVIPIYDITISEPDFDCDGIIDRLDNDIDGDGVPNELDMDNYNPSIGEKPNIGVNDINIGIDKLSNGVKLVSIKRGKEELLNDINSEFFSLMIQNTQTKETKTLIPSDGWNNIKFRLYDKHIRSISLSQPKDSTLPSTLKVVIIIDQYKSASVMDLKVTGLGEHHSLLDATFPNFTIKAENNSHFFLPLLFGQVIDNPQDSINKTLTYPLGSDHKLGGASMQYLAYYTHNNKGMYFGFHDPKASIKKFHVKKMHGGINIQGSIPIPNRTHAGNNWDYSGIFAIGLYKGDWYEAAQLYKHWVYTYSKFKPVDTAERLARAAEIAKISLWTEEVLWTKGNNISNDRIEKGFTHFKNFLKNDQTDITLGVHWNAWSGEEFDKNIPDVFLQAKNGLSGLVSNLKEKFGDKMMIDLYTNAYLYDIQLPSYASQEGAAVKNKNGNIPHQTYNDRKFAIMCPTQKTWQDKQVSVHKFINTLGVDGVYLDQVTASRRIACTDKSHGHPIGGGDFWRTGYTEMVDAIHAVHPDKTYLYSETVVDSLIGKFDGFMTMYHTIQNQVPALQTIYGGKVQFFGPAIGTGAYTEDASKPDFESLYALAAQGFAFGEILGPIYPSLSEYYKNGTEDRARKDRAATYIKKLAFMREKLKNYIALGTMKKPLILKGNIPTITVPGTQTHHGTIQLSAIQNGVWKKGKSVVIVFINGNKPDLHAEPINFQFTFDGAKYGLSNNLSIQEVTATSSRSLGAVANKFTKSVTLESADIKGYILTED